MRGRSRELRQLRLRLRLARAAYGLALGGYNEWNGTDREDPNVRAAVRRLLERADGLATASESLLAATMPLSEERAAQSAIHEMYRTRRTQ